MVRIVEQNSLYWPKHQNKMAASQQLTTVEYSDDALLKQPTLLIV